MGERPNWASTWVEPLLRPTVAGHGVPADSPRGDTLLPQGTVDAMRSQSWKTRCKAAFEAYSALLLRQGWEPDALTGSLWGDLLAGSFPKGWNHADFNEELSRHGCKQDFASDWFVANLPYYRRLRARCAAEDAEGARGLERELDRHSDQKRAPCMAGLHDAER